MYNKEDRTKKYEKKDEFDSKLLDLTRVERMSAGGRRLRFRAVMVIGNKAGKVGLGIAKGLDVAQAIEKATRAGRKHLIEVPIVGGTIPFEAEAKSGAARIFIRPQRKGRGLVAGGTVRVICNLAGIENICSKVLSKSRDKVNNTRATLKAFEIIRKKYSQKKQ